MNVLEGVLLWTAVALYVCALLLSLVGGLFRWPRGERLAAHAWPAAGALHLLAGVTRWVVTGHAPVMYAYENSLAGSFFIPVIYLFLQRRFPILSRALPGAIMAGGKNDFLTVSQAVDRYPSVRLDDKEEVLASVLLDLSQTATLEASNNVARHVLKSFENIGELHFSMVQKAGFLVLKSPDVPSILVETAFISNPGEERKLKNDAHQSRIARAIFYGVRNYFKQYTPTDTRVARL